MTERRIVEYGDQLWARRRDKVEFYDEELADWMLWHPDHHATMPPPTLFEKTLSSWTMNLARPRFLRGVLIGFGITSLVWAPLEIYIYGLEPFNSPEPPTWVLSLALIARAAWQWMFAAALTGVAVAIAMATGERRVWAE